MLTRPHEINGHGQPRKSIARLGSVGVVTIYSSIHTQHESSSCIDEMVGILQPPADDDVFVPVLTMMPQYIGRHKKNIKMNINLVLTNKK